MRERGRGEGRPVAVLPVDNTQGNRSTQQTNIASRSMRWRWRGRGRGRMKR